MRSSGLDRSRRRAVVLPVAVVLVLAVAGPLATAGASPPAEGQASGGTPAPLPVARRVLVVGDSAAVDATPAFDAAFTAAGADEVVRGGIMGFGLTRSMTPGAEPLWRTEWPRLVEEVDPDLTIVMVGGWDLLWLEEHGVQAYLDEVVEAEQVLTSGGGSVLWLSMLPGGHDPYLVGLDDIFADAALQVSGVHYLDIAFAMAGPRGGWPISYIAADDTEERLRKPDGWHLCQDGAARLARYVADWAVALRLSQPSGPGWEQGEWWDDIAYESPTCWPRGSWLG